MKKEIREGNILIAKFYGNFRDINDSIIRFNEPLFGLSDTIYTIDLLNFHSSWNNLMPVIQKIKTYWFNDNSEAHKVCSLSVTTPIQEVWLAVVEFIKQFNAIKKYLS